MYDYLIKNAMIVDGTGKAPFAADVAIKNKKIAAIGELKDEAQQVLDAAGRYLTPGFIDVHRHGEAAAFRPGYGKAELAQGLTLVINGNCGLSMTPVQGSHRQEILDYLAPVVGDMPEGCDFSTVGEYKQQLAKVPQRIHNGMLVGMGTLRGCAAGFYDGKLDEEQYAFIYKLLKQGLEEGALGVSLGLGYAPECFYDTEGMIKSLEPLKNSGTVITVHMRQEGDEVVEALEEMITVAKALNTPMQISHLKAIGTRNWNRCVPKMIELLRQARAEGVDITCDVYPYPAGSTQLIHVLPPEFQAGGMDCLTEALLDPEKRAIMKERMKTGTDFENISLLVGFENIQATSLRLPENKEFEGMSIVRIAEKYIEVPCAVVSPNQARMDQVAATIDEWKADGVVSITLHSCNPFAIETENIRRVCERCGVPLLHIETDFGTADEGQIRTRIEAYLEMIRAKKEMQNG